jgi:hypothetical protein
VLVRASGCAVYSYHKCQGSTVIWRDITQVNAPGSVMFSADTSAGERWMRKRCGGNHVTFSLPADHAKAVAFKEAAEAAELTIIALTKRASANF